VGWGSHTLQANFLSNLINDRFITPAVQKDTSAFAVGVIPQPNVTLRDTLGQYPDSNYDLLYAIYQAHADVSACVALWAGGVTGDDRHRAFRIARPSRAVPSDVDEPVDRMTITGGAPHDGRRRARGSGTAFLGTLRTADSSVASTGVQAGPCKDGAQHAGPPLAFDRHPTAGEGAQRGTSPFDWPRPGRPGPGLRHRGDRSSGPRGAAG
jgi:hypothetical protein